MKKYPRTPAFFVLLACLMGAYAYIRLNRPEPVNSQYYESIIASHAATDQDWINYFMALAKEDQFERLPSAFKGCSERKIADRSIKFTYIQALARQWTKNPAPNNNPALDNLYNMLDSQVQIDPKLVLDAFDRPEIAALKTIEKFDALSKSAQKNAAD